MQDDNKKSAGVSAAGDSDSADNGRLQKQSGKRYVCYMGKREELLGSSKDGRYFYLTDYAVAAGSTTDWIPGKRGGKGRCGKVGEQFP